MSINKIGILGAGAVGASIAHQITKYKPSSQLPSEVFIIAENDRAERYNRNGLLVNGDTLRLPVVCKGNFDMIILATKSYHLDEALVLLDACVGEHTLLMSLLNGIASEGILGERYGHERVIPAMILGIDAQREAAAIRYANEGVIHYGPNPLVVNQDRAIAEVDDWFLHVGLGHRKSDNITKTLWRKFMINVGANQASALYKAPYSELQADTEARALMLAAMAEVVALSQAEGTGLTPSEIDDWDGILQTLDPTGMTSMAQDAVAGRRTEVDIFAGTIVAMAEKHGLHVPINRMLNDKLGG